MPRTTINGSLNITSLDSKVVIDMCAGKVYVDVTPSTILLPENIIGVKIQVANEYGVFRAYPSGSTYDIVDPFTSVFEVAIPRRSNDYIYGKYTVTVKLIDEDESEYTVVKEQSICAQPDSQQSGNCADALVNCKGGTFTVVVNPAPVYQGKSSESKTQEWTVLYPANTLAPETTSQSSFSLKLYPGIYQISGTVCATYNFGDNCYVKVPFTADFEKSVRCQLDFTCVTPAIKNLQDKLYGGCSEKDKEKLSATILEAFTLINSAQLYYDAGKDPSDTIARLEELLGCECTCGCGTGVEIINGLPAENVVIEGCGITSETVGLTTTYTINNYSYVVTADPEQNVITASSPSLDGCTYTTELAYSPVNAYAAMKTVIANTSDHKYWADEWKKGIAGIPLSLLGNVGLDIAQFNAQDGKTFVESILAAFGTGGAGTISCTGTVQSDPELFLLQGGDVVVQFTAVDCAYVTAFLDGVFVTEVSKETGVIRFVGAADDTEHTFVLFPKCINGLWGTPYVNTFEKSGCPVIASPVLSQSSVIGATCPYDATGLVNALPAGITAEFHNQPNILGTSLVSGSSITSGVYYVYAKNIDGCYSTPSMLTLVCATGGNTVTAPQQLRVDVVQGGYKVSFASPTYPPNPLSYIIKRRLKSDADIDASYTIIAVTGTPNNIVYNGSTLRYECNDITALQNKLYVYRAISNGGANPFVDIDFADIVCPETTISHSGTNITVQFVNSGGDIDGYDVQIYDGNGVNVVVQSFDPAPFTNPESVILDVGTTGSYQVRLRPHIGDYIKTCPFKPHTIAASYITGPLAASTGTSPVSGTMNIAAGGTFMTIVTFNSNGNATTTVLIDGVDSYTDVLNTGLPNDSHTSNPIPITAGAHTYSIAYSAGSGTGSGSISIS